MSIEDIKPDTSLYTDPADRLIALGLAMKSDNGIQRRSPNSTSWESVGTGKELICFRLDLLAGGYDYRAAPPKPEAVYKLRDVKGTCRGLYEDEQSATEIAKIYGLSVHKFVEVM